MSAPEFPWESDEPAHNVHGFTAAAGPLKINLGFAIYANGMVLLYATESLSGAPHKVWRRLWTTVDVADDVAEHLCYDVQEYLEPLVLQRPAEDLDMEDFLECLHLYCQGMLH